MLNVGDILSEFREKFQNIKKIMYMCRNFFMEISAHTLTHTHPPANSPLVPEYQRYLLIGRLGSTSSRSWDASSERDLLLEFPSTASGTASMLAVGTEPHRGRPAWERLTREPSWCRRLFTFWASHNFSEMISSWQLIQIRSQDGPSVGTDKVTYITNEKSDVK